MGLSGYQKFAPSLRKADGPKHWIATNYQPHSGNDLKFLYCCEDCRSVGHVAILLRFCTLGSRVGFCGNAILVMGLYFRGGCKPNSLITVRGGTYMGNWLT